VDKDEALWMALGVLEFYYDLYKEKVDANVITAIKAALAQPKQEPVAWELRAGKTDRVLIEITNNPQRAHDWKASLEEVVPLYTTPPQRKPEQESDDLTIAYMAGFHAGKNKDAPQPEQEPVAMRYDFDGYGWLYIDNGSGSNWKEKIKNAEPLYTTPPQRKPLTDERISGLWDGHTIPVFGKTGINPIVFARAIEAAHGIKEREKNT